MNSWQKHFVVVGTSIITAVAISVDSNVPLFQCLKMSIYASIGYASSALLIAGLQQRYSSAPR
jgi:hypothetical protein